MHSIRPLPKVIDILNSGGIIFEEHDLDVCFLNLPQQLFPKQAIAVEDTEETEQSRLELRTIEKKSVLTAGYPTKDDLGEDGNNTVHETVKLYDQPNCIQGKIAFHEKGDPETDSLCCLISRSHGSFQLSTLLASPAATLMLSNTERDL
jgi:hypothetical protein